MLLYAQSDTLQLNTCISRYNSSLFVWIQFDRMQVVVYILCNYKYGCCLFRLVSGKCAFILVISIGYLKLRGMYEFLLPSRRSREGIKTKTSRVISNNRLITRFLQKVKAPNKRRFVIAINMSIVLILNDLYMSSS